MNCPTPTFETIAVHAPAVPLLTAGNEPGSTAREEAVVFGVDSNLVGVYTPANDHCSEDGSSKQPVLLVTAGMLHNVGPFRLHVELARQLAEAGAPSLRFDLSGIGESLPSVENFPSSLARAAAEIGEAASWICERESCEHVGVFGLCSGADDAMHAALEDQRLQSLFLMEGCAFPTFKFHLMLAYRKYGPKLLNYKKWLQLFQRVLGNVDEESPRSMPMGTDIREFPDRLTSQDQLQSLIQQGKRIKFYYAGNGELYNYRNQFFDMFPEIAVGSIDVEFDAEADHVTYLVEHRERLINSAVEFFQSKAARND